MKFCKIVQIIFKTSLQFLLSISILVLIFIPVFLTVLLPIYTYRYLISKWSNLFISSHGKILTTLSSMFAVDDMSTDPTCTILLTLTLEDNLKVDEVRRRVKGLISIGKYPELQQSLSKWMGFFFWKSDPSFSLDNHILTVNKPMGDKDIEKLKLTLLKKPFIKDKPLWDITIITNYIGKNPLAKSVCFNRFHHCLVDGFSLYKLNSQLSDSPESWVNAAPKYPKRSMIQNLLIYFNLIAFGPFDWVSSMLTTFDRNEWKVNPCKTTRVGILTETDKVVLADLKSIAKMHCVSVSALLFASYTGAMRRMMMKYGKRQVPGKVTVICPFPMPGHPDKLRIHVTMAPIQAPLGNADPVLRLQLLEEQFNQLKKSTLPLTYYYSIKVLGGLFPWMIKLLTKGSGMGTGIVTNFPGPKDQVDLFGCNLTGLSVLIGVAHGSQTSGCAFVSYGGRMCITTGFDKALFSEQERAHEFLTYILNEFEVLKNCENAGRISLQII